MGAVRNLFVRIGGDASGAVKGFKDASRAGANAEKSIKKSSAQTKRSIRETFASSVPSIKEYTAQIAQTKSAHQTASQNVSRLEDEIGRLTGIYDTVKNATAGLDMSKPLSELMVDAEKTLTAIESKRKKLEAELSVLESSPKAANSKRTASLQAELNQLAEKSRFAEARLADLDRIADAVGADNMGYASVQGLEQLQQKIQTTKNELATMQQVADETGHSLKSMGVGPYIGQALKGIGKTAAHAAGTGVQKLWGGLKKLGGGAVRGIASLPSKLRNIGRSAASSTGGLTKMVRSIRNIGIASLGMRGFGLVFGELRSVITDYLNQNEELNQSIKTMKSQLGEALAPAINIVVIAMQRLMPVVTAVSNGINSIFKSLFGDIAATSKKIESATEELNTYGFDQITKESDDSEDKPASNTTQLTTKPAWVKKLTSWLQQIKKAFKAGDWKGLGKIMANGINSAFKALVDIDVGAKVGTFINNALTTIHSLVTNIDFSGIGATLGRKFTQMIERIDWALAGRTIGATILALPKMLVSFVLNTNWAEVAQSISECLIAGLKSISEWIKETDWLKLGECVGEFIVNVDWSGLADNAFSLLGSALAASVSLLWGVLDSVAEKIGDYFAKKIEEQGGNVVAGLFTGIGQGFANLFGLPTSSKSKERIKGYLESEYGIIAPTDPEGNLPKAARGTIVSKATNLTVGEDGTEAIMPLERHTEWIDVLASKLAAKTGGTPGGGGGGSAIIQIFLGNRKVTEHVIKDINQITRENGVCPIHV